MSHTLLLLGHKEKMSAIEAASGSSEVTDHGVMDLEIIQPGAEDISDSSTHAPTIEAVDLPRTTALIKDRKSLRQGGSEDDDYEYSLGDKEIIATLAQEYNEKLDDQYNTIMKMYEEIEELKGEKKQLAALLDSTVEENITLKLILADNLIAAHRKSDNRQPANATSTVPNSIMVNPSTPSSATGVKPQNSKKIRHPKKKLQ